ncbi:hypothetical protein PV325_010803 [Microctonus aethiopoides]|nr:hypothetical protein PV325_010803 [Microctonus aethiopoides]KAK0093914.1 hypothetical protein PV326_012338 [Microctonus aethiopoides]
MLRVTVQSLVLLLFNLSALLPLNQAILLFPKNTILQFTLGITVPIITNKEGSLASNLGFQLNYVLPWNLTQLQPQIVISTREKNNNINLQHIYTTIENLLEKFGWSNGRQCLLRSICEIAETPLGTTSRDVVEEIIHLLLTPTEDLPEAVNSSHRSTSKLYQEAEQLGRSGGDCLFTYPDCIESPLESFTDIELF